MNKRKKQLIKWSLISAFIMLGFPWLAVTFAPADAGMAVCLLLFYVVNPIYSVILGCIAGQDIRRLWVFPLLSAILFWVGAAIFFTVSEPLFIFYAGIYLIFGVAAMLITFGVKYNKIVPNY